MLLFDAPLQAHAYACTVCDDVDLHGTWAPEGSRWLCTRCSDRVWASHSTGHRARREHVRRWLAEGDAYLATLGRELVRRREAQLGLWEAA